MDSFVVIGDIHGCAAQLRTLLEHTDAWNDRAVVFVGDYVDIGPDSKSVIELLLAFATVRPDAIFLQGNHDLGLLRYLRDGDFPPFASLGGTSTLRSYLGPTIVGDVHRLFALSIPDQHRLFLERLVPSYKTRHFVFSHSGDGIYGSSSYASADMPSAPEGNALSHQGPLARISVFGHYFQRSHRPLVGDGRICVDTGCGAIDGPLTALTFPECDATQVWPSGLVTSFSLKSEISEMARRWLV